MSGEQPADPVVEDGAFPPVDGCGLCRFFPCLAPIFVELQQLRSQERWMFRDLEEAQARIPELQAAPEEAQARIEELVAELENERRNRP